MGTLSTAILNALGLNIISGRKNTAAHVRAVVGTIADAVALLEGRDRGARILGGAGAPAAALGNDGDAYFNTTVSDLYLKEAGVWNLRMVLRGQDGASAYQSWLKVGNTGTELAFVLSLRGSDGRSAYQSWLQAGNTGSEVQFVASLAGRSAYQSWLAAGNTGTEAQFVASLKAKDGDPGEPGNRITASATAPGSGDVVGDVEVVGAGTTFANRRPGDIHYQTLNADRFRIWYQDRGSWVVLFTSPTGAAVADGSVTNAKLADDVKAGSLAAARIAFPLADRINLNSFTDMVAWCASGVTNMVSGLAALTTRVKTLEERPVSSGGGTSTASPTALGGLTDVFIAGPAEGQILTYSSGKWVNATAATGGAQLPNQSGNQGKYLSTNGTSLVWASVQAGSSFTATDAVAAVNTNQAGSATIKESGGRLEIADGSIKINHFDPAILSNATLSQQQKDALSNAANWNGKVFTGVLTNSLRGQFHADTNYLYTLVQDNFPVRCALS